MKYYSYNKWILRLSNDDIIIIITRVTRIVTDAMYLCYSYMKVI